MASSVPIDRQWIFILQDGTPVLDLGEDLVQDLLSGDFVSPLKNHTATLFKMMNWKCCAAPGG